VANFGDLQNEIYLAGLSGVVPSLPMSFAELERRAELALPPGTWSYVAGGAGDEHTQRSNRTAFDHWGVAGPRSATGQALRPLPPGPPGRETGLAGTQSAPGPGGQAADDFPTNACKVHARRGQQDHPALRRP